MVANEVKELAQETAKATEDIARRVLAIQGDTTAAVAAIEEIIHDRRADLRPADHHRQRGGGADGDDERDVAVGAGGRGRHRRDRGEHHRGLGGGGLDHAGAQADPTAVDELSRMAREVHLTDRQRASPAGHGPGRSSPLFVTRPGPAELRKVSTWRYDSEIGRRLSCEERDTPAKHGLGQLSSPSYLPRAERQSAAEGRRASDGASLPGDIRMSRRSRFGGWFASRPIGVKIGAAVGLLAVVVLAANVLASIASSIQRDHQEDDLRENLQPLLLATVQRATAAHRCPKRSSTPSNDERRAAA